MDDLSDFTCTADEIAEVLLKVSDGLTRHMLVDEFIREHFGSQNFNRVLFAQACRCDPSFILSITREKK